MWQQGGINSVVSMGSTPQRPCRSAQQDYIKGVVMAKHIGSTATTTSQPKPGIPSLVFFFGLVFFATWIVWVPRALESRGLLDSHWAHWLGRGWTYMPALAAVVFVALTGGRRSLAELGRKLLLWRIGWRWYVVIVTIPLGIALTTAAIYALTGGQFSAGLPLAMDLPLPMIPLIIAIRLLTDGIGEETAWRGVALPQLLRRMNGVTASLILGIVWACWHLPLIFTVGAPMANNSILLLFVLLPAESVVYTWLYQHTRGSILAAALFHALIGLWAIASPAAEATGRPQLIRAILWCAVAGVLLLKYGTNLTGRRSVSTDGSPRK
jgi:membrane protease YdiL (CAAX protease family)